MHNADRRWQDFGEGGQEKALTAGSGLDWVTIVLSDTRSVSSILLLVQHITLLSNLGTG